MVVIYGAEIYRKAEIRLRARKRCDRGRDEIPGCDFLPTVGDLDVWEPGRDGADEYFPVRVAVDPGGGACLAGDLERPGGEADGSDDQGAGEAWLKNRALAATAARSGLRLASLVFS